MKELNCPNCGAPITDVTCPYCGTVFYDFASILDDKPTYIRIKFNDDYTVFRGDTSDATASASEILAANVAYVNGVKVAGEMGRRGGAYRTEDDDGYLEHDYIIHDNTVDDGFCDRGERENESLRI